MLKIKEILGQMYLRIFSMKESSELKTQRGLTKRLQETKTFPFGRIHLFYIPYQKISYAKPLYQPTSIFLYAQI